MKVFIAPFSTVFLVAVLILATKSTNILLKNTCLLKLQRIWDSRPTVLRPESLTACQLPKSHDS